MKITTDTGLEMFRSVTPAYNIDDLAISIFEANGKAMDDVRAIIENLKKEMYPQNATWTLDYWEQLLGIEANKKLSDDIRVQKVLFELNKYFTITKYRLEHIVNTFIENKDAFIEDIEDEYAFIIIIPVKNKILKGLRESVEDTKPAHLLAVFEILINAGAIIISNDTYHYPVYYPYQPVGEKMFSLINSENIEVVDNTYTYIVDYPVPEKVSGIVDGEEIAVANDTYNYIKEFLETGVMETLSKTVETQISSVFSNQDSYGYKKIYPVCGEFVTGGEW